MLYAGPAKLRSADPLLDLVESAAVAIARELRSQTKSKPLSRGATLRPGVDTPHWLALVELARPHLRQRGAKASLARELGLHRARVTEFFESRRTMPDAERTLLLMQWLRQRAQSLSK